MDAMGMDFCPPNATLDHVWIHHGVNICFLETVSSSVIAGFIMIFGVVQLAFYRRHGTRLTDGGLPSALPSASSSVLTMFVFLL